MKRNKQHEKKGTQLPPESNSPLPSSTPHRDQSPSKGLRGHGVRGQVRRAHTSQQPTTPVINVTGTESPRPSHVTTPPSPPGFVQDKDTKALLEYVRMSRMTLGKPDRTFPSTSPQGRALQRKFFSSSERNLLQDEDAGRFSLPRRSRFLGSQPSQFTTVTSKNNTTLSSEESVLELKGSPAKTQVPSKTQIRDKPPFRAGLLIPPPVDSGIVGQKALSKKPGTLTLTAPSPPAGATMKKKVTPNDPQPSTSSPYDPKPLTFDSSPTKPTHEESPSRDPKKLTSDSSPTRPNHPQSSSPDPKNHGIWHKFKHILRRDEVPKSTYLQKGDESRSKPDKLEGGVNTSWPRLPPRALSEAEIEDTPVRPQVPRSKPEEQHEILEVTAVPKETPRVAKVKVKPKGNPKGRYGPTLPAGRRVLPEIERETPPSTATSREPHLTSKMKERLAKKVEGQRKDQREKHLKHLHAKYSWKRLYVSVKASLQRQREEAEAEEVNRLLDEKRAEVRRLRQLKKDKRPKKGWFTKLIDFFDEDEGEDYSDESLDEEEEILLRASFQQLTLGERRAEIRGVTGQLSDEHIEPPPPPPKHRRGSDVIRAQQISAAARRVRLGGSLGMAIPPDMHPLKADNIEKAPSYENFAKGVRTSLPSTYALPHDNAAMRLFDKLVPLLKPTVSQLQGHEQQERIHAAEDAFDEFRVAKLHSNKSEVEPALQQQFSDIRFLPGNLEERRGALTKWEDSRASEQTCRKRIRYFFKDNFMMLTGRFGEIFRLAEIWHEPLHQIEMNFGVSASTYFRWLRSVLLLNCLYCALSLGFIVIPELLHTDRGFLNLTTEELFLAESFGDNALFFYGWYIYAPYNPSISAFANTGLRFIFVIIMITFLDSIFIGLKVRTYYMRMTAKISDSDKTGEINFFALFLSAWDYNLTSETAVKVQHRTIARDFNHMMDLYEDQLRRKEENPDDDRRVTSVARNPTLYIAILRHWLINLGVFTIAILFGFGVYSVLSSRTHRHTSANEEHLSVSIEILSAVGIPIALNIFSPLCSWVTSFESFKTIKDKIFVVIFRLGLFYISILSVLYFFWISNSHKKVNGPKVTHCWEEDTGTEIYRLLLFEGIANAFMTIIRYMIFPAIKAKWMKRNFEKTVFDVEYFTLNLIFIHTLSGVGTFFFPLLPLIVVIRLLVSFYWQKFVLNRFCANPPYQLHPSEIFAPYVVAFFCSFLCVIISNSWLLSEERPSPTCGPFSGYANTTYSYVFQDVVHSTFGKVARYMASPWFLYCTIIILAAVVYTFHAWTAAYFETMNLLHDLLRLERLDREFLLRAMYNIPGVERQMGSNSTRSRSGDSLTSITHQHQRDHLRRATDITLFLKQQEQLARLFEERPHTPEDDESLNTKSTESDSSSSKQVEVEQNDVLDLPIQRDASRRYKHLMLSAKALQLLRRRPRRLSRAANLYSDLVDKVIELTEDVKLEDDKSPQQK